MPEQAIEPKETAEGQQAAVETEKVSEQTAEAAVETAKPAKTSLFKDKTFKVSAKDGTIKTLKGDETLADVEAREKADAEKEEKSKGAGKKEGEKPEKPDSGKGEGSEPPGKPEDQKTKPGEDADDLIKPDDPKGVQKRIKKAVTGQREAERRAETLQKRLEDQEARLAALETGKAKPEGETVETGADETGKPVRPARPVEPKDGDFDNYEDYEKAAADYKKAAEKYENDLSEYLEELAELKADQKVRKYAAEQQTKALEAEDKKLIDAAVKKHPDFVEIAIENDLEYTETMFEAIYGSESFADLAYHLGSNPEQVERIAKLSPIQQVRELTRIELGLQAKSKSTETDNDAEPAKPDEKDAKKPGGEGLKRTTQADEPIKPVKGAGNAVPFDPTTASVKQLQAHLDGKRIAEIRQRG